MNNVSMNQQISVLMPTRGRPNRLKRMLESLFLRASQPQLVEVVLRFDDDDITGIEFSDFAYKKQIKKIVGPTQSMGILNSECFENSTGDIIVLANDDVIVQTKEWDRKIRDGCQCFDDGIFLGYPNDLHKKQHMATFPIMHRRTLELLENPFPHEYEKTYIDLHIMDIFKRIEHRYGERIVYFPEIVFEHFHPYSGKINRDKTYHRREDNQDDVVFRALSNLRERESLKLLNALGGTPIIEKKISNSESLYDFLWGLANNHSGSMFWRAKLAARLVAKELLRRVLVKGKPLK